jgi:hypothetical protein
LKPSIGSDSLLYSPVILLDHVVQILAGSHPYAGAVTFQPLSVW